MSASWELAERVRERAEGTPYLVEETAEGFLVRLDVANARWYAPMVRQAMRLLVTHHVAVDANARTFTIRDELRRVPRTKGVGHEGGGLKGDGDVPVLSASAQLLKGKYYGFERRRVYVHDEDGEFDKVVDYRFDSREGHRLIQNAARDAGWTERMPGIVKGALVMAIIGGAGGVAAAVAVLVGLALGKF